MFSLLWSEHCSYKHSKKLLRTLPTEGPRVVMGPGENAGAVDVGDGLAIAFKVESHNHPSAVEPFQGAATGVGGILRDIFAIGARPIAVLDSLRFGEPTSPRSRYLLDRAVAGIGHYGNSIGVPTIGGEVYFEGPYEQNCLVNAMALGLARADDMIRSAAGGRRQRARALRRVDRPRRDRRRVGARVGGAGRGRRGQAPDGPGRRPVRGEEAARVLARAARAGLLVSLQDLGAAGLTSSAAEMASKGEVGRRDRRRRGAAARARPRAVRGHGLRVAGADAVRRRARARRRGARAVRQVGRPRHRDRHGDRHRHVVVRDGRPVVGDMPVAALVDDCPLYDLEPAKPPSRCTPRRRARSPTARARARRCWRCSRRRTSRRGCRSSSSTTGSCSRARCAARAGRRRGPAAAERPRHRDVDRRQRRRVACDPYNGTVGVVFECAANLACVGAEPLGTTNNLNFGNPRSRTSPGS
jgi:phosphoribosylformylglycinamidine synthase